MNRTEIRATLGAMADMLTDVAPAAWRVVLSNGFDLAVDARCEDGWVALSTPLAGLHPGSDDGRLLQALAVGRGAGANARVAVDASGVAFARADVAMHEDTGSVDTEELRDSLSGLRRTVSAFRKGNVPASIADGENDVDALKSLCAEAGWSSSPRPGHGVAVDLEVAGTFRQAMISACAGGRLRIGADLQVLPFCSVEQRRALALFLLRVSALLRGARPVAEVGKSGLRAGFEQILAAPPSPRAVSNALGALSVAVGRFGAEAEAITRAAKLSKVYLQLHSQTKP